MKDQLRCLFLQNNALTELTGLEQLHQLVILDVSHNKLRNAAGLDRLPNLTTLYIGHNKLTSEPGSIDNLQLCSSLNTIDLSRNKLSDSNQVLGVLQKMSQLRVLYLHGNPVVRDIDPYRTRLILLCVTVKRCYDLPRPRLLKFPLFLHRKI